MSTNQTIYVSQTDFTEEKQKNERVFWGIVAILVLGFITLLVTVIGLVLDSYRFKAETYQNLVNQVNAQNTKMDFIIMQLGKYQFTQ